MLWVPREDEEDNFLILNWILLEEIEAVNLRSLVVLKDLLGRGGRGGDDGGESSLVRSITSSAINSQKRRKRVKGRRIA